MSLRSCALSRSNVTWKHRIPDLLDLLLEEEVASESFKICRSAVEALPAGVGITALPSLTTSLNER